MQDRSSQIAVAVWLLICCCAVYAMVVLGGVTRLTGSGLSMVKWEPIIGILPPMGQVEWQQVFELYQQSPEFKLKNSHMDVEAFKGIFWFEYAHRVLGRLIGIIFFVPLVYFIIRKKVDKPLIPKLIIMFVLGGLQGLLGWYMVKSGLVRDPHVSQYRLTAHLGLAFLIYAYMFWVALDLLLPRVKSSGAAVNRGLKRFSYLLTGLTTVTVLSGGFVAGLKAGLAYNTFPTMNGQWLPDGLLSLDPYWRNFFDNVTTVQFDHRVLAAVLFVLIPVFWFVGRRNRDLPTRIHRGLDVLLVVLLVQIGLGISTLLLYVPVALGATHQGGAVALFTATLFLSHQLGAGDQGRGS
ncbi:MAG: heme A synthase [Gammaproteobacteria bacterium]|nr:heme A synthase [Gammaproteobacteria bacterium]